MKKQFQEAIETIRKHVLGNLELIKANEAQIKNVLTLPESPERTELLNDYYVQNKNLLNENNDFINLQVSVLNLMNKHRQVFEKNVTSTAKEQTVAASQKVLSREDYFRLTIEESLDYDHRHPYFNDINFFNDLLDYLKIEENYELCAKILHIKEQLI